MYDTSAKANPESTSRVWIRSGLQIRMKSKSLRNFFVHDTVMVKFSLRSDQLFRRQIMRKCSSFSMLKEFLFLDPDLEADDFQNSTSSSLCNRPRCVYNFLFTFCNSWYINICGIIFTISSFHVKLPTDKQTDIHTDRQTDWQTPWDRGNRITNRSTHKSV